VLIALLYLKVHKNKKDTVYITKEYSEVAQNLGTAILPKV
jgi:hypothetical protein